MIDTSPFEVTDLLVGDKKLKADPPLRFKVEYDEDASCYTLEGDFETYLYAYSREELESILIEVLQFLWTDYAQEREDKLAPSGKELKLELLHRFRQV